METRPQSIVNFERFYVAAIALGLVNTALSWRVSQVVMTMIAGANGTLMLIGWTLAGLAISVLLWYFIARKGSAAAKWIAVVLVALAMFGAGLSLSRGSLSGGFGGVIGIVNMVLQIIALTFLFKADAKPWFGETREKVA